MRESLYSEDGLEIVLVVDEDADLLIVEILSTDGGPDLSVEDEVVVVTDGEAREVEIESSSRARAVLGEAKRLVGEPFELMVRVHEVFEGWDFDDEE